MAVYPHFKHSGGLNPKMWTLLTHWGRVTHICISKVGHHWFRWWLVPWTAPSHYLNHCRNIVNWTPENKLEWNLNRNLYIFIQENAFQIIVTKLTAILSRPQCVYSNLKKKKDWTWVRYGKGSFTNDKFEFRWILTLPCKLYVIVRTIALIWPSQLCQAINIGM